MACMASAVMAGTPASAGLRFSKESRMLDFVGVDRDRIVGLKQLLVEQVEGSSDWRARKAVEYDDNAGSNLRASEDLLALAKSLDDLADDDPLWLTYACAIETGDEFIYLANGWRNASS